MSGKVKTRDYIVEAADQFFYQQGYEHTSFANIAEAVQISRGNFYHHFKTKDHILDAVIDLRLKNTQQMLEQWEIDNSQPAERIRAFIHILIVNKDKIKRYGCPVGSLCAELAKLNHTSRDGANKLFTMFLNWLSKQFILLGHEDDAEDLAMHLLARSQGAAMMGNVFQDEKFIKQEVKLMCEWLQLYLKDVDQLEP